jgi:hypothetical protein
MTDSKLPLACAICHTSIALEETKVTEDGQPVQEECYYQKIKKRKEQER